MEICVSMFVHAKLSMFVSHVIQHEFTGALHLSGAPGRSQDVPFWAILLCCASAALAAWAASMASCAALVSASFAALAAACSATLAALAASFFALASASFAAAASSAALAALAASSFAASASLACALAKSLDQKRGDLSSLRHWNLYYYVWKIHKWNLQLAIHTMFCVCQ